MNLEIYTCKNGHRYSSRKDPNAKNIKDRPQCGHCGERYIPPTTP